MRVPAFLPMLLLALAAATTPAAWAASCAGDSVADRVDDSGADRNADRNAVRNADRNVDRASLRDADPALWVLKDDDTTIWLFGTIHVLQPGLSWFDEAVAAAFDSAEELRTEVPMPEDPATLAPLVLRYAVDPDGPALGAKLTAPQRERYYAGLARANLPAETFERFHPWFVELQFTLGMLVALGMDPEHGVDQALYDAAKARGKRLTAFETVEEQMRFISAAPEAEQIASLLATVDDAGKATAELRELVDSWAAGDPERTGALLNETLRDSPETARVLLTDRNRRWAQALAERLREPGIVFVAVGAGHLAGRDSVQDFLAQRGLKVERVPY